MSSNKTNILRQPHGPDGTRGFKNHSYRLVPLTEKEFIDIESHFVIKEARVPKKYLFRDIWLSKTEAGFKKIRVYLTQNQVLMYDLDYKLIKINHLDDGYEIKQKIINNNYYIIFCRMMYIDGSSQLYDSKMYRIKDKHRLLHFWNALSKLEKNTQEI